MELLFYLVLDAVLGGGTLWIASKITTADLSLQETVLAAGAASLAALVPGIGWLLAIVVLLYLLKRFSEADLWPDIILLVLVSRIVAILAALALLSLLPQVPA